MKKRYLFLIIFVILVFIITFALLKNDKDSANNSKEEMPLYSYNNFSTYNVDSNFSIENNFSYLNQIYYKVINSYEEYENYKNMWNEVLDVSKEDFEDNFMIITVTQNESMANITLGEIYAENNTLFIGMKKDNNISNEQIGTSILIDKSLMRDNIEIFKTIEIKDYYHENFIDIKELPQNYSTQQAQNDNCICDLSDNIDLFYDFLDKVNNKQDTFIRLYTSDINGNTITDISYISNKEKFIICTDETRLENSNCTYNYYEYTDLNIKEINSENLSFSKSYTFINSNINEKDFGINL